MKFILIVFAFYLLPPSVLAQPFREDINAFHKLDSAHYPPKKANLFVGSSSFRFWESMEKDFAGYPVINRGFGGSTLKDVIRYVDEIIYPYDPKQVIIYCGENDLAESDTVSAQMVNSRFQELFYTIRNRLGKKVRIVFISIKPSPSRAQLMPKMELANQMIRQFLKKQKKTKFVDIYHLMLTPSGKPREELFIADRLHMNAQGYGIWIKAIRPVLKK